MKFCLAITGSSGVHLGLRFLHALPKNFQNFVIFSAASKISFQHENPNLDPKNLPKNCVLLDDSDIGASVSSGSFGVQKMAIIPTSGNTLAKISHGISDTLITRAAAVMLKERRTLLLAPRELPFGGIMLQNMAILHAQNAIIAPPVLGYYAGVKDLISMENFIIGKWLDALGISHELFARWGVNV